MIHPFSGSPHNLKSNRYLHQTTSTRGPATPRHRLYQPKFYHLPPPVTISIIAWLVSYVTILHVLISPIWCSFSLCLYLSHSILMLRLGLGQPRACGGRPTTDWFRFGMARPRLNGGSSRARAIYILLSS